jgi:hypothetical protein
MSKKPSELGEEYILRMRYERREKLEEKEHKNFHKNRLKKGVDKCFDTKGIWLDAGELCCNKTVKDGALQTI